MSLPVFIDEDPRNRKVRPNYLPLLFKQMGLGFLARLSPGERDGMFYVLHLGSPYRLSPDNAAKANAGGIFIYDFLDREAWKKIQDRGGYLLIDHIVEASRLPKKVALENPVPARLDAAIPVHQLKSGRRVRKHTILDNE